MLAQYHDIAVRQNYEQWTLGMAWPCDAAMHDNLKAFECYDGRGGGVWVLANHPRAIVDLLLTRGNQAQVVRWDAEAIQLGAGSLLLLSHKGNLADFKPANDELTNTFRLLTLLARRSGATFAADDYVHCRLGMTQTCVKGFVCVRMDGSRWTPAVSPPASTESARADWQPAEAQV